VIYSPSVWASFIASITGTHGDCEFVPYDSGCVCSPIGERKISVPWFGLPKWDCENLDLLLIDPESPTFQDDAIAFTKNYLTYYCGSTCDNLDCGEVCGPTHPDVCNDDLYMTAAYGYGSAGERLVSIECVQVKERYPDGRQKSGSLPWRMMFLVESPTEIPVIYDVFLSSNYCVDSTKTNRCAPPEYCDYRNNEDWCIPNLLVDIMPTPIDIYPPLSIGSGYPASVA
jgi:hypothetical protein